MYLSEQHEYYLNSIIRQDTISILNTDYQYFKPPYLNAFCKEIQTITSNKTYSTIEMLEKMELWFRENSYKECNFPRTYRADLPVVVTIEDLAEYKRRFCQKPITKMQSETRVLGGFSSLLIYIIIMFVIV